MRHPYRALLAVAVTIPVGSLDALCAWAIKPYMDIVMIEKQGVTGRLIPLLFVGVMVVQSILNYASSYLNTWVGQRITTDVKQDMFTKLLYRDPAYFDHTTSGDVMFRYSGDVDMACSGLIANVRFFVMRTVSSILLLCVMFWNSFILASVSLAILCIAVVPLTKVRKRLRSIFDQNAVIGASLISNYSETFNGNRVIAAYNLQDHMQKKMDNILKTAFRMGIKVVQRTGGLSIFMHSVIGLGLAATIWLQGYLIENHQLTPGNFVSFIAALVMLYTPLKGLGNHVSKINQSIISLERVFAKMEESPTILDKPDAIVKTTFDDAIRYEHVGFHYSPDIPVLTDVNLEILRGQKVAFVGHSGSGKSTIVNLLPRFYDVVSGSVRIDGVDVRDMTKNSLRNLISVVFQDNFLFSGTFYENILLAREDATREQIMAAAQAACLEEFIDSLPNGIDTQVGERGVMLSGGQRQRVAIARAIIRNSPIVILDEATSALDNQSEAKIQEAIENLMHDRTVLIVAHRLTTVINSDKIVVVNEGRIAEAGTHATLFGQSDSIYRQLYDKELA